MLKILRNLAGLARRGTWGPAFSALRAQSSQLAFTLIELVVVISIIGVMLMFLVVRTGTYSFWKEETFIRRLSETVVFLHHQAILDQLFYVLRFDFEKREYSVGTLQATGETNEELINLAQDAGNLSLELATFLSPAIGHDQDIAAPANMPSLAEPVPLPPGTEFMDIRTMRGLRRPGEVEDAYVLFSPRGFSEFAVIHVRLGRGNPVTILVNPFTGLTDIYRSYRDFEWTYGKRNAEK